MGINTLKHNKGKETPLSVRTYFQDLEQEPLIVHTPRLDDSSLLKSEHCLS